MKLLLIPTCQRVVTTLVQGVMRPRLCGKTSVAVYRRDDGQEHFVCVAHNTADAATGTWHLHRGPALPTPPPPKAARPKRQMSEQGRARIAEGQRARWARHRQTRPSNEQRESA